MATYPTTGSLNWDLTLKPYIDSLAGGGGGITVLAAATGTDDTTAINAVLAASGGGLVRGIAGQAYKISAPLVIKSGTTLDMTGCTITLNASSNCNMLNNASVTAQRTVSDGAITSGTNTLTSATAAFTTNDTGRSVVVQGAAGGGYMLVGLMTFVSSTSVTLTKFDGTALNAGTTVSGASTAIYNRDTNIRVIGGTWDRAVNGGTVANLHSIRFRHVDGLIMRGLYHKSTSGGKYALSIADCTAFLIDDMDFAVSSDGVHLVGPCDEGTISNMRGSSHDDFVALTATDWPTSSDSAGDITDILITDINGKSSLSVVKVMGGPAGGCKRITAQGIRGTASVAATAGVWIGDDTGNAATIGGLLDDIRLLDCAVLTPSSLPTVLINGINTKRVEIDGLFRDDIASTAWPVQIAPGSACTFDRIAVRNVTVANLASAGVVVSNSNATITTLDVSGVHVSNAVTSATSTFIDTGAPVGTMLVRGITVAASTGGNLVAPRAAVTRMIVGDVSMVATTNAAAIVWLPVTASVITDLVMHDVQANCSGASSYALSFASGATSATVTRASLSNVRVVGGGGFVQAITSTQTLTNASLMNCLSSGASWVADLNTTTDLDCTNVVNVSPGSGTINVRANAVIRWRGSAGRLLGNPTIAAGGKLAVVGHEFIATSTAGGVPTVAAGAGAGTGASVSIVGTDRAGTITVTLGTSPAAGAQMTLTFIGTWPAMKSVDITPTNSAAASANTYVSAQSGSAFTVSSVNTPGGNLTFNYAITA